LLLHRKARYIESALVRYHKKGISASEKKE
jgi:hypothetical protein